MVYPYWLAGLGFLFVLLERVFPRRAGQPLLRTGVVSDLAYIVINSHYLGIGIGSLAAWLLPKTGLDRFQPAVLAGAPFWTQFLVALLAFDFLQWCIHNLLHRVGWLWEFHKVHHSIVDMDWVGDWRFHWFEIVVYRSLLYLPAAFCGIRGDVLFWVGVLATLAGHFAHANVRWNIGPLKYIINSPEMHIWHHNHPDSGPINRNFGISLAIWDWIFGTAYVPAADPHRLGFEGIEDYPRQLPGQWWAPFAAFFSKNPASR